MGSLFCTNLKTNATSREHLSTCAFNWPNKGRWPCQLKCVHALSWQWHSAIAFCIIMFYEENLKSNESYSQTLSQPTLGLTGLCTRPHAVWFFLLCGHYVRLTLPLHKNLFGLQLVQAKVHWVLIKEVLPADNAVLACHSEEATRKLISSVSMREFSWVNHFHLWP